MELTMNSQLRRAIVLSATASLLVFQSACMPQHSRTASNTQPPPESAPAESPVTPQDSPAPRRVAPAPVAVSPGVAEVITLVQGGVDESVVKAHMTRSTNAFNPTVDELVYLTDIGIPGTLVSSLIQQTVRQREQAAAMAVAAAQANQPAVQPVAQPARLPAGVNPEVPVQVPAQAQPAQAVIVQAQPQVVVVQQQLPAQVSYFYNTLSPYGTWVEVAPYGWCWQPTVAVNYPRWRPYADRGRWLWTNGGWYWQSDYSWGWAPFHYGRWVLTSRVGWAWVPDLNWGPAWVTWRYSDAYCGWAPLPPGSHYISGRGLHHNGVSVGITFDFGLASSQFSFVSWRRFCDRNPHYYIEPSRNVQNIYNNTTIINNYGSSNNLVINNGVPPQRVQALARIELREVLIKDAPVLAGVVVKPDRLEKEGSQLVLYRPQVQVPSPSPALQANPNVPPGTVPVYANGKNGPVVTGYTSDPASIAAGIPVIVGRPERNTNAPSGGSAATSARPQPASPTVSTAQPQTSTAPTLRPVTSPSAPVAVAPGPNPRPRPIALQPAPAIQTKQGGNPNPSSSAVVKPDPATKPTPVASLVPLPAPIVVAPQPQTPAATGGSSSPQRPTLNPFQPVPYPSRPTLAPLPSQPSSSRPVATPQPAPVAAPITAPSRPTPFTSAPSPFTQSAPTPAPAYTPPVNTPRPSAPSFTPAPTQTFTPAPAPRAVVSSPAPAPSFSPPPTPRYAPSVSVPTPAPAPSFSPAPRSQPVPSGPSPAPASSPSSPSSKPELDKKR